ncbi:hypothetical protein CEP54_002627 [Fusarium duplospermum]|uniref:Uncharacterized protein n=1 Tax=Fusarium duplospermum TaxID=1325734 RepID=A0A428QTM8_9HYPO|nr:hypothetical protein CEP54_002627 [Fusarium duplospermum]
MSTPRLTGRCGLCNFKLHGEDIVIVVNEDGEKSEPLPFHPWARIENDDEVAQLDNAHPVYPDIDQCAHPFEEGVGCHPSCLRIVDGAPLDRVLQLSAWSFQPSPRLERARHRWLQEELASRLEISLPLPAELRRAVAGHLIQEFVVAKNASLSLCDWAAVSNVSVASAITETYTTFEGQRYLHSIRNAPVSDDSWVTPEVIYVAEDHAGIRQVILANDFIKVSDVPGVWWKSFSVYGSGTVGFHSDGIKLRYISYRDYYGRDKTTRCLPSFSVLRDPEFSPFRYLFSDGPTTEPRRMSVFRHNEPDIIGYSICCDPAVLALHTHYRFDDDLSCYESTPENAAWIYMPIKKDERIDHIWVRRHRSSNDKKALAFEMNSGRLLFFGGHKTWTLDEHKYQWTPLFSPCEDLGLGLSLFFFDSLVPFCIRELGFDRPCPSSPRTPVLTSPPLSLPADPEFLDNPHWSCASVEDVVEVVPCRQTVKGETMITGLLLHYPDIPRPHAS